MDWDDFVKQQKKRGGWRFRWLLRRYERAFRRDVKRIKKQEGGGD